MDDIYSDWRRCLDLRKCAGSDVPLVGFWRKTIYRGSHFVPLAVFIRDNQTIVIEGDKQVEPHNGWTPFAYPVTELAYRRARETGRFGDEFERLDGSGSMTTDLRQARPVLPIKGTPHGNGRHNS